MDNSEEICLICQDTIVAWSIGQCFDNTTPEDELMDLRLFLCKILSIPLSCFEYCGFPFCQNCTTTRVKELVRVHNQLLALQISYTSLKQNLLREIVTVYVRQNFNSKDLMSEANRLTDSIIKKWRDYIVDSGFSSSEDDKTIKNEILDFSGLEIKDEFCDLSENSISNEIFFEELDVSLAPANTALQEYSEDNNLNLVDVSDNSVINYGRQRKSRRVRLNYCDKTDSSGSYKDDDRNIRNRKKRKGIKPKVTSSSSKVPIVQKERKVKPRYVRKMKKCPHCPRTLRGTDTLQIHMRIHTNDRPYVCSECNQAFRQEHHLNYHKKARHGYHGKTKTVEGLNEIASKHRTYHCVFCSSVLKNKGLFMRHLMSRHKSAEIEEGDTLMFYYCDAKDCLASCANQDELKNHFARNHKDLLSEDCSEFPECDICRRVFTTKENLEIHKSAHSSKNNQDQLACCCEYCCQIFKSETEMNDHFPSHKVICDFSDIFCHLCDLCGKSFKDASKLLLHKRTAHSQKKNDVKSQTDSRIYFCGLCDHQLKSKRNFLFHLKREHSQEINEDDTFWFHHCDAQECLASFTNEEGLKKHFEESHKTLLGIDCSEFPQCNICQRVFALQESLEIHKKSHNSESLLVFGCEYCRECSVSKSAFNGHLSIHKVQFDFAEFNHLCELCGKEFSCESGLKIHVKNSHENNKVKCPVCGKDLLAMSLRGHMKTHENPSGHSCSHCPHISSTSTNLQLHVEKIHPSVNTKSKLLKHTCKYCEKEFYVPFELHRHSIRQHSKEYLDGRSFCCSCYKTFDTEDEMEGHFNAKHPHLICSVEACRKKFHDKKRLWLHTNVHNKEKPFVCEYCQQGFSQETSLQVHINTKHTFHRSFRCKLCPDNPGYYQRVSFKKHLESMHPTCAAQDILITNYPKRKYFF